MRATLLIDAIMRLSMFSPTTPCTGSTRALIGDFFTLYYRFAPRGWGISTLLSLRVCVWSKHGRIDDGFSKVEMASGDYEGISMLDVPQGVGHSRGQF